MHSSAHERRGLWTVPEDRPAFLCYAKEWIVATRRLSPAARGVYWDMICFAWLDEGLPADPDELRQQLGVERGEWRRIWPKLAPKWVVRDGTLHNARLEEVRRESADFTTARVDAGRRGGQASAKARAAKHGSAQPRSNPEANPEANAEANPEAALRSKPEAPHEARTEADAEPLLRSKLEAAVRSNPEANAEANAEAAPKPASASASAVDLDHLDDDFVVGGDPGAREAGTSSSSLGPPGRVMLAAQEAHALWVTWLPDASPAVWADIQPPGRRAIAEFVQRLGLDRVEAFIQRVAASDYLAGRKDLPPMNFFSAIQYADRILAGAYDNRTDGQQAIDDAGRRGRVGVPVKDPLGPPGGWLCAHAPTCTTWAQCRDLVAAEPTEMAETAAS